MPRKSTKVRPKGETQKGLSVGDKHLHLEALEEIENSSIPGFVEVLREEGLDAVRYVLWDAS